jgi:AcrR family transcriptional regulator
MVARACGLTNPAVHYHFRTKRDLYDALLSDPVATGYDGRQGDRIGIAANMEERFYQWVDNVDFARLLLRQQIGGDPQSLDYLRDSERVYVEEVSLALAPLVGTAAGERAAQLAFTLLSGAFWDALLTYGNDAASIMRDSYFRDRIRRFIQAALRTAEREAP